MNKEKKEKQTASTKELRAFGLMMCAFLSAIGGILYLKRIGIYEYLIAGGVAFGLVAIILPAALRCIHSPWMKLGEGMAWINTRLILAVAYYILFTLTSLILRLLRKDLLDMNWKKKAETWWIPVPDAPPDKKRYERMF